MALQIVGCVLTMLLVMYLCYKGISPIICAPAAVIGICIATGTDLNTAVFETFAQGIGSNVAALLFYFCASGFMSLVMQETGAADAIASLLSRYIGERHVPICIILVCGILSMAGLGLGAMIIAFSVGVSLCRKANYSTDIIYASVYAGCIFVSLPYVASANNMLASLYCGTDPSAGAVLGFIGFGVILSSSIFYLEWLVRRWKRQGRVFEEGAAEQKLRDAKDCPNIIVAVLPLVGVL